MQFFPPYFSSAFTVFENFDQLCSLEIMPNTSSEMMGVLISAQLISVLRINLCIWTENRFIFSNIPMTRSGKSSGMAQLVAGMLLYIPNISIVVHANADSVEHFLHTLERILNKTINPQIQSTREETRERMITLVLSEQCLETKEHVKSK
jgi:hypothetical protein